VFNIFEH
jgi:hypothetical protein